MNEVGRGSHGWRGGGSGNKISYLSILQTDIFCEKQEGTLKTKTK